ncbi:MAG: Vancomycin B-type resistance protein VanW [Parcubacteria bacterium C7867-006]|nr:MAG: Vancomycin B-type resistance protein VanW [Parcubacteria bacterium C7867-006]
MTLVVLSLFSYEFLYKKNEVSVSPSTPALVLNTVKEEPIIGQDLLGKAEVSFAGGTDVRNKNIELGIARINGKVLMPGEEFSFTKTIGPVTEEDGFGEAKVFLNGEVTTGVGGGLCQVSTTLFQSVLKAGLPVTERWNHTYSVVLYDVGLDATYSDPGPDFKFKNDTANPVVIKGKTEDQKAVFEIYGVSDGRQASTTEPDISQIVDFPPTKYVATTTRDKSLPECINSPQIGYTSKITYGVLYPNGTTTQQIFTSTYKPLQRVCYVYGTSTTNFKNSIR